MCGIAGIISKKGQLHNGDYNNFRKSTRLMHHRGPDSFGEFQDNRVGLFHYRLSIIDLDSRSNQPFFSEDDETIAVYNGELYNYKEISQHYNLYQRTTSDTEVIVESFNSSSTLVFNKWNGIFAACLYKHKQGKLTLIRDRFGVKPLYYYENEKYFVFASEAKIIYNWLSVLEIDYQALAEYIAFGCTYSNNTICRHVKKVEPASYLNIDLEYFEIKHDKFWSNPGTNQKSAPSFENAVLTTTNLLEKAVKRQLIGDVSIGVFLSGGIDSSAITALASRNSDKKLNTYSVEFDFNRGGKGELDKARLISKTFNTNHHEFKIESKDLVKEFEELVFQHDDPFSDSANIPLHLMCKEVRKDTTVVLQGDGGDEIFAGYRKYTLGQSPNYWRFLTNLLRFAHPNRFTRDRAKRVYKALSYKNDYEKIAYLSTSFTNSDFDVFNSEIKLKLTKAIPFLQFERLSEKYQKEDLDQKMLYFDVELEMSNCFLDKVDKSTMLNSIESRVPFLDNDLTDFVLGLPSSYKIKQGEKKHLLKKSLRGIIPDEILDAPKRGFGVPMEQWLRTTMREYLKDKVNSDVAKVLLNTDKVNELILEHLNYVKDNGNILWRVLVLLVWVEKYQNKLKY